MDAMKWLYVFVALCLMNGIAVQGAWKDAGSMSASAAVGDKQRNHEVTRTGRSRQDFPRAQSVSADGDFTCDNGTTLCPASASGCCNFTQPVQKGCVINGTCCRQGVLKPPSTTLPNCLILGDSVSDGYTPIVQQILNQTCQVQHTPYAYGSGGAGPVQYGLACLEHFLLTGKLVSIEWDVIFFNFGLHNLVNSTSAEQLYRDDLNKITEILRRASKKVIFGLTTPFMPDYTQGNHVVEDLNRIAASVMQTQPSPVPIIDLYSAVVKECGPVPYKSCSICRKDPCQYHYTPQGYELIAAPVAEAIKNDL
eukprot:scpid89431/ scgid26879/ 